VRAVINTLRVAPEAALPTGQVGVAEDTSDDPASGALRFEGLYAWTNPAGEFIVNGQVVNQSTGALEAVRITAVLYDSAGAALAEQGNVAAVEVLPVGGVAPFSVRFRGGKPAAAARYELNVAARYAEYALNTWLGEEKFIRGNEIARYDVNGYLTVSGDVVNSTQGMARFVKAIVTVLDDQGRVVATDSAFASQPDLPPGATARFQVTFLELGGSAIRYIVTIEGKSD
jgi:hypothetical protein